MPVTKDEISKDILIGLDRVILFTSKQRMIESAMDEWAAIKTADRDARIKELEDGLRELTKQYKSIGTSYAKQNGLTWEKIAESGLPIYETATKLLNTRKG